ncbi:peroxiredoxin [Limoniibacter endophyticus]|uniref:thioredoxin-dependent peroxiredoxin n=1 Tax=Limoniibacter endophyticus TaxID=1565040 RepID=A0A8J3GFG7_9HYPH|nr:peroxiredoxin [Limoniibacter endophyticus]GHC62651.1 peroxiredoxin [Limoniibacter endophyticus]
MTQLEEGRKAPDFSIKLTDRRAATLGSFAGKPLVIFFYPKDNTQGCTLEANEFSALLPEFERAGIQVIGVSPDDLSSHEKFCRKHDLKITLGSDPEHAMLEAYGVWKEKSMYGRTYMGVERTTLLLDKDGTIIRLWPKVKAAGHAADVLEAARIL